MFKSTMRPIVIPQSEHEKLAGTLAFLWGNTDFDLPPVSFASLVMGIGLHDRGYGPLDTSAIGTVAEVEWLAIQSRGYITSWQDPVADLITKFHLKRLLSGGDTPDRKALLTEMEAGVAHQLQQSSLSPEMFERIDRITNFCDRVSFDFCFEQPFEGVVALFPRNDSEELISVCYRIEASEIYVDPWPFSVETYSNYLIGYMQEGYPARLAPVIIPYRLLRVVI